MSVFIITSSVKNCSSYFHLSDFYACTFVLYNISSSMRPSCMRLHLLGLIAVGKKIEVVVVYTEKSTITWQ